MDTGPDRTGETSTDYPDRQLNIVVDKKHNMLNERGEGERMGYYRLLRASVALCIWLVPARAVLADAVGPADTIPPSIEYGDLYSTVELAPVFPDSKTFPDMIPSVSPEAVLSAYDAAKGTSGFDLTSFVNKYFSGPTPPGPTVEPATPGEHLIDYVESLWPVLEQSATTVPSYSSLLPLPYPYVVPGGRFREVYYWDSYFTMLGLEASEQDQLAVDMLKDFAYEIDRYQHIPNGNRSYYLSRSQPPFFSLMVELIADHDGLATYTTYLPELQAEYGRRPGAARPRV
jgi:alpha,alpha-trehalase